LSLSARIAIALHLFRGYCNRRGLSHPEIDRFVNHLWEFISLPPDGAGFKDWEERTPPLTYTGLGDEFPPGFELILAAAGVPVGQFEKALSCTTEVLYVSMYGACDEAGSRRYLLELASVAESIGVEWPDMECFQSSRWEDDHGWGGALSDQDLLNWKKAGRS